MKLSVVILTKGEKSLDKAIESVSWADEIVVIEDKAQGFEGQAKIKTFQKPLKGDFAEQRNFGLEKSRGDWILFIDSDEAVRPELADEIKNEIKNEEKSSFYIKRRDWFWGREVKFGEVLDVRRKGLVRLVKRGSGKWMSPVHETFHTTGSTGKLDSYLEHYPHQSIREFLEDVNFYSTLRARELQKMGKKIGIIEIILYPFGKFIVNYFFKFGFLDGPAGFVYAFMMSFHSFLVRAKLYQYTKM